MGEYKFGKEINEFSSTPVEFEISSDLFYGVNNRMLSV